jgi:hypothetical protein
MVAVMLKTLKPSRMGNYGRAVIVFDAHGEVAKVLDVSAGGASHGAKLAISTTPSEIKSLFAMAKARKIFAYG